MEDYFRVLIEKCKEGKLSAGDILSKVASTNFTPSQSENEVSNRATKPKSMHPEKYEKLMYKLPTSSLSASTKPTEFPDTQESELNNPSIAEGIEEPEEDVIDEPQEEEEEEDDDAQEETETWNVMFEKQMKKRQDFWKQYKDRDLQQYIEEQLTTIFDNIRTVHSREQLEDIKRKCRFKWFLRMKKLRDSRKAKEEEEFVENCSFHPKINDSSVKPRYLEIQTKPSLTYISRECTFSPDLSGKLSKSTRSYGNSVKDSVKDTVRSLGNSLGSSKNSTLRQFNNKLKQPRTISDIEPQHSKNGKIYLDDDLNEFMGSLCSVGTYEKESSPRMHIRELQASQEEPIRIEKALNFTACKDKFTGDSRRHSTNNKAQSFLDKHGLKSSNTTKNIKQHDKDFSFERLAIPRATSIKAVPKDPGFVAGDWNTSTKTPVNFKKVVIKPSLPTGKIAQEPTSTKNNRERSTSRQERFTERKAGKMSQLDTETKIKHPFRPQVSQASESLDKKALEEYSHRDKRLDERKDRKMKKLDKENQEKHPFKPQLSKAAQTLDRKVYEEKVANFVKNREERLEKLREQSALKELEGVTHQPKINKAVPASSKLGINLTTSEYITYLKEKEEVDRQFVEIAKRRKEAIEAIECTHTPQISAKPLVSVKSSEFSSPKVSSLASSQGAGYKDIHQKKKQTENSGAKLTSWNFFQKENIFVPSLFDEGLHGELSFDQCEYSYKNGF